MSNSKNQEFTSEYKMYPMGQRQIHDWEYHYAHAREDWGEYNENRQFMEQLDVSNLKQAYQFLFERHESLRTAFPVIEEEVTQQVFPYSEERFGLRSFEVDSFEELEQIISAQKSRLADLQNPPLAFGLLFYNQQIGYLFTFHIHHIIADAFSMAIIQHELTEFYVAFQQGAKPQVPPLHMQLGEFLLNQNLKKDKSQEEKYKFWINKLKGAIKAVDYSHLMQTTDPSAQPSQALSQDRLEEVLAKQQGAEFEVYPGREFKQALDKTIMQAGMSAAAICTSTLKLLMNVKNNRVCPLIAVPVSTRFNQASAQIIGNLMGGMYMINKIEPRKSLGENMKKDLVEYFENLDHVIYNHDFLGDLSLRTSTDISINYQIMHATGAPTPAELQGHHEKTQVYYALELYVLEFKDQLVFRWKYNTDLLTPRAVENLSQTYLEILKSIPQNIDLPIQSLWERSIV